MQLSDPVEIRVLRRRENGSGVIEIPLLPATEIDLARTATGTEGKASITVADLEQIAANFPRFPGPVPIGVQPHQDFGDRAGFAPGFVDALVVRGDTLFGQLDVIAPLFAEIEAGGWRGFSVEISRNLKTATVDLDGWALTGGVFTNRPATDVHFRIAASDKGAAELTAAHSITIRPRPEDEVRNMADKVPPADPGADRVVTLEGQLKTQESLVGTLRAQAESMAGDKTALEARLRESAKDLKAANIALAEAKASMAALEDEKGHVEKRLKKSEAERRENEIKLEAEQARSLSESVRELATKAIDRGVSAKHFEGLEEDPAAWFAKRYVSLEAMSQFLDALPTVKESATTSGRKPDERATLSQETAARLRRMGLDPQYAGITSEDEIFELAAKRKETK
jgi:hypothetical protein